MAPWSRLRALTAIDTAKHTLSPVTGLEHKYGGHRRPSGLPISSPVVTFSMERLAPEIKLLILGNVDEEVKTLINCAGVSHEWRPLAQKVLFEKHPMYIDRTKSADFLACWQAKDGTMPTVHTLVFSLLSFTPGAPKVVDIRNIWADGHFAQLSNLKQLFLGPRLVALSELGVANEFVVTLLPPHPVVFAPLTVLTRLTLTGMRFGTVQALQVLLRSLPALTSLRLMGVGWLSHAHQYYDTLSAQMPLRGLYITVDEHHPNYAAFRVLYAWILRLPAARTLEDVTYEKPDILTEDPFAEFIVHLSNIPGSALSVCFPHAIIRTFRFLCAPFAIAYVAPATTVGPLGIALDFGPRVTIMMLELPADARASPVPGSGFSFHQLYSIKAPAVRELTLQLLSDFTEVVYKPDLDPLDPPFAHFGALERLVVIPLPPIENLWCTGSMLGVVAASGRQVAVSFEGGVELPDGEPIWADDDNMDDEDDMDQDDVEDDEDKGMTNDDDEDME
jgi:hypothetical protein